MDENETPEDANEPTPAAAAAPAADPTPGPSGRSYSLRAVLAVGVATLLIGGAGGAVIVAATDDDGRDHHRMGWFSYGPGPDGSDRDGIGPRCGYGPRGGYGDPDDGYEGGPGRGGSQQDQPNGSGGSSG